MYKNKQKVPQFVFNLHMWLCFYTQPNKSRIQIYKKPSYMFIFAAGFIWILLFIVFFIIRVNA